jgi:hypothetical protein
VFQRSPGTTVVRNLVVENLERLRRGELLWSHHSDHEKLRSCILARWQDLYTSQQNEVVSTPQKLPKKKKHKNTSSKTYTSRNWKTLKAEELRTCGSRPQDEEHEDHQERKQVDARHKLPPHRGLLVCRVVDLAVVAHVYHNRSHLFFFFFF